MSTERYGWDLAIAEHVAFYDSLRGDSDDAATSTTVRPRSSRANH
jgi:hypothetical protein